MKKNQNNNVGSEGIAKSNRTLHAKLVSKMILKGKKSKSQNIYIKVLQLLQLNQIIK